MKLGTMVYNGEIYNLDYMNSEEIKNLLYKVESDKERDLSEQKSEREK